MARFGRGGELQFLNERRTDSWIRLSFSADGDTRHGVYRTANGLNATFARNRVSVGDAGPVGATHGVDGLRVFHSGTSLTHYDRDGVPEWRLGTLGEELGFSAPMLAEIRTDPFGRAFDRGIGLRVARGEARDGAFFGDSIVSQLNGLNHPENRVTWLHLIDGHAIVNAAIAGDRIRHSLGRMWAIEPTAKLIAVQIGTNDNDSNSPRADPVETAEGIARFVAEAQRLAPNAVLLLVAIPPTTDNVRDLRNQVTNELIAKLADGDRVRFADPSSLVDMSDTTQSRDGLHFLPASAAVWYGALAPIFAEILMQ